MSINSVFAAQANVIPIRSKNIKNLPSGDITRDFIPSIIKMIMSLTTIAIVCMALYAGYLHVTNFGDEEKISKANKLLMYAAGGVVIIVISYAIVYGITQIQWNRTSGKKEIY
ncbi:MAG: hypothetical protein N4A36_02590 [Candidatus Gracilibacteria bacterium]|nr:hypothetical protein [Candidatus Gracilibacteria bacterium]